MFTLVDEVPTQNKDNGKEGKERGQRGGKEGGRGVKGGKEKGKGRGKKGKGGQDGDVSMSEARTKDVNMEAKEVQPPPPTTAAPTSTNGRKDRGPARLNPAKSFHQLPRFVPPTIPHSTSSSTTSPSSSPSSHPPTPTPMPTSSASTPDPAAANASPTPSLAYLILGPRTRGRFNAQRADELGLKGPLRGRVSKGETVTFMVEVDDPSANGGKGENGERKKVRVERTVRPEECVGESEAPVVRVFMFILRCCRPSDFFRSFLSFFDIVCIDIWADDMFDVVWRVVCGVWCLACGLWWYVGYRQP